MKKSIVSQNTCLQKNVSLSVLNWKTKGACSSAAVYSIIETEKANGFNVYTYFEYLLLYMSDTDWRNHLEDLEDLMLLSEAVQAERK